MTHDPTAGPEASAAYDPGAPDPNAAHFASSPSQGPMPPYHRARQPWINPDSPGGPPSVDRPSGFGPAVAAVLLGLLGCVVPLLPIDMNLVRVFIAFPFAVPGIALAIVGCSGRRRGNSLAAIGGILSVIALVIGAAMIVGHARNGLL